MNGLGINIGSTSVKLAMHDGENLLWHKTAPHDGNVANTLKRLFNDADIPPHTKAIVTGNEGRQLLNLPGVIESVCIEEALSSMDDQCNAVVSMGGEDLVVYTIDDRNSIITSFSGNKCAAGTGEFFKQQLGRMDMTLEDIQTLPDECRVMKLSTRCSVFMKSDCTHRLNKGEATKGDIVVSLSNVMAVKVVDFLKRARISSGRVLLAGGITRNPYIHRFISEKLPDITFVIPEEAAFFEAYGAALLALRAGGDIQAIEKILLPHAVKFSRFDTLQKAEGMVQAIPSRKSTVRKGREYILGVDGGSTTTKACLIDTETHEVAASFYGRTHGDPVKALKQCLEEIRQQVRHDTGEDEVSITLAATTGSSREILGVFLETSAVYNEIIAHAVGTTYYNQDVDTIFEIGGQDAKYVYLKNKVPIDYAMNEACSAGTGSFLEESARGDLNIGDVHEIGDIALQADEPLKFGEHCSAFINSDIRKAIQQGASREDITAGLVTSIVSNYLNRVVGNRTIGNHIVLQGGVAKNKAVPLAFALLLNKPIVVPPDPELMGCFGVGLLAQQKNNEGFIEKSHFTIEKMLSTKIVYEREFKCRACDNYCPIQVLRVNDSSYMFGGRCNKYTNMRKKKLLKENEVQDYIQQRNDLLFTECAPDPDDFIKRRDISVGIPAAFSVYSLWPLYSWFFHQLGISYSLSDQVAEEGVARVESAYCFPAEIAHGAVKNVYDRGNDYIFVPHFRDMESYEDDVHATFCPITQGLPYYIEKAFPEISTERILSPVISFKYGDEKARKSFIDMAVSLGVGKNEASSAFDLALGKQKEYFRQARQMGTRALEEARRASRPVIALLGRPYNAFTRDANMGIPKKFTSNGYSIIPYDILPFEGRDIFSNMYWYYGQQDMKTATLLKNEDNIYVTFISNFSCAPDSFILHYLKWTMGTKPFLILELDSHTADAGIDTRVEAFLDIIEGYRLKFTGEEEERYDNGLRFINPGNENIHVTNTVTGEKIPIRNNPRVKMLLSNMGRLGVELLAASLRSSGINAEALPVPDNKTLQMARQFVSGKECLPSHLVLGSALQYLASDKYRKDDIYLLFVPTTTGPCRTGQYFVFYENLFKDLRLDNVVVITLDSDNSYNELGTNFSRHAWWGVITSDYMKDIETSLRACAKNPVEAMQVYDGLWQELIDIAETDVTKILPALKRIASEIKKIPLKRTLEESPRVLIVGEIYVRRDDFAVDELIQHFSRKGIVGKVSGVGEWIYYCDFTRRYDLKKELSLMPWYVRPFSKEIRELGMWHVEQWYKHRVERMVKEALSVTGLVPETPHDMNAIMGMSQKHFVNLELQSEITVSSGVAASAMADGYSGIVNISPFACLIGRVIEGLLAPWSRERRYPLISVEIDGSQLPPTTLSKLEIFMLNVLRFRHEAELHEIMEHPERMQDIIDRKIIKEY